jgi:hypothetical protein
MSKKKYIHATKALLTPLEAELNSKVREAMKTIPEKCLADNLGGYLNRTGRNNYEHETNIISSAIINQHTHLGTINLIGKISLKVQRIEPSYFYTHEPTVDAVLGMSNDERGNCIIRISGPDRKTTEKYLRRYRRKLLDAIR